MKEVKIHGLGIERDLHFSPTALHEIAELEELVQGRYSKEVVQTETQTEDVVEESFSEGTPVNSIEKNELVEPTQQEKASSMLAPAPEGVPALTLQHQYEADIRTDLEAPREMGGQMVYFDDDHHHVMDRCV